MDILKKSLSIFAAIAVSFSMASCYTDFEPDIPTKEVLCMNSLITAGEPVEVTLTHTWLFSDGDPGLDFDINVADAELELFANGVSQGRLSYDANNKDEKGKLKPIYKSTYIAQPSDEIELRAHHHTYGDAHASTSVPEPVDFTRVISDISYHNAIPSTYINIYSCDMHFTAEFTDPATSNDFYVFTLDCENPEPIPSDREVTLWPNNQTTYVNYSSMLKFSTIDYDQEPIFSEHLSTLENMFEASSWGYSMFSDRSIDGLSYPLNLKLMDCQLYLLNPQGIESLYNVKIKLILSHISQDYYNYLLSLWELNDGLHGTLGSVGFGDPVYAHSNVSSGAGIVAARCCSTYEVNLASWIKSLPYQGFNE